MNFIVFIGSLCKFWDIWLSIMNLVSIFNSIDTFRSFMGIKRNRFLMTMTSQMMRKGRPLWLLMKLLISRWNKYRIDFFMVSILNKIYLLIIYDHRLLMNFIGGNLCFSIRYYISMLIMVILLIILMLLIMMNMLIRIDYGRIRICSYYKSLRWLRDYLITTRNYLHIIMIYLLLFWKTQVIKFQLLGIWVNFLLNKRLLLGSWKIFNMLGLHLNIMNSRRYQLLFYYYWLNWTIINIFYRCFLNLIMVHGLLLLIWAFWLLDNHIVRFYIRIWFNCKFFANIIIFLDPLNDLIETWPLFRLYFQHLL